MDGERVVRMKGRGRKGGKDVTNGARMIRMKGREGRGFTWDR